MVNGEDHWLFKKGIKCGQCRRKVLEEGYAVNPNTGKLYARCEYCRTKGQVQQPYEKKKKSVRALNLRKRDEVNKIKLQRGCENKDCKWQGDFLPGMLHFDHLDPNEKSFTISRRIDALSLSRIIKEISKCRVLCANCHMKHTAKQMDWHH